VFIKPEGEHCEIAVTPHVLTRFIRRAESAMASVQDGQLVRIKKSG
jgi:hypothetical protein